MSHELVYDIVIMQHFVWIENDDAAFGMAIPHYCCKIHELAVSLAMDDPIHSENILDSVPSHQKTVISNGFNRQNTIH